MTQLHGRDSGRTTSASARTRRSAVAGRLGGAVREARSTGSLHVLVLLLLPVPLLLVAHQLHFEDVPLLTSGRWAVNTDGSFIEILGYAQLAVAAALLLVLGTVRRQGPVHVGWAATLVLVLLDDALRIHERGGGALVERGVVPDIGLPQQALGELFVWALLAVPVLLVLLATHRISPRRARSDSWRLAGLTLLLMAFAIGVDVVHEVIEEITDNAVVDLLVTFVEAGGEVGAMTCLLAYVVHISRRTAA